MAVVQISKIQVRRGLQNSNSGVPQLSSAEFAWAVDTQKLYIGNGSVGEGAPYVGNTEILTEHTNLLELISFYRFAEGQTPLSIDRSLQSKLDEYVSVLDFGAIGDGATPCDDAFEAAFQALYRNTDLSFRKILVIPNGEYRFTRDLIIPAGKINPLDADEPFKDVVMQGETKLGAVLNIGANNIRFITASGKELAEFDSTDRPRNVIINNLTIQRTTGQTVLSGLAISEFNKVKFVGEYALDNLAINLTLEPSALYWENLLGKPSTDNVKFTDCEFESVSVGIRCFQTGTTETRIFIDNCRFYENNTSIYVNGTANQSTSWTIRDSVFESVGVQAFRSTAGKGTQIKNCKFVNCGRENTANPLHPFVYFGDNTNNILVDCISDRQQNYAVGTVDLDTSDIVEEVYGGSVTKFINRVSAVVSNDVNDQRALAVFSTNCQYININYFLKLGVYSRVGKLTITVDTDLNACSITDDYQYSPILTTEPGGSVMTNFTFDAVLRDNKGASSIDTIVLTYVNPAPAPAGSISFDVAYGV